MQMTTKRVEWRKIDFKSKLLQETEKDIIYGEKSQFIKKTYRGMFGAKLYTHMH